MGAAIALLWRQIPLWLKLALAIAIAVAVAYQIGKWAGATGEREAAKMAAIKEAAERVAKMENSNAYFRRKSARDKCLVIMRDSGLPDSACD